MRMILLGAGASIDAGVPGALDMTNVILKKIRDERRFSKHGHALSFIVGGLLFDFGIKNKNPLEERINIEDLFNAVQLLAERNSLEAAPFISSWHSFIDELDAIHPDKPMGDLQNMIHKAIAKEIASALREKSSSGELTEAENALNEKIKRAIEAVKGGRNNSFSGANNSFAHVGKYFNETAQRWSDKIRHSSSFSSGDLNRQIDGIIASNQAKPGEGKVFKEANEYMIAALKDLVFIAESQRVSYLAPILNTLYAQESLYIATLNYDNAIELLSETYGIECETGIDSWSSRGKVELSAHGVNLIKLHGSIDWQKDDVRDVTRMPTHRYQKIDSNDIAKQDFVPAVIFGSKNKLTADGPYLELLRNFTSQLDKANELVVVGYSFRDEHINIYISNWLNSNRANVLRVINGEGYSSSIPSNGEGYVNTLFRFAKNNPGRIEFIDKYAKDGLLQYFGEYTPPPVKENYSNAAKTAISTIIDELEKNENEEQENDL